MTYKEARAILPLEHICQELARQKALEALEKQIPKKIIRKSKNAPLENIKCPNCQREIDAMNIVNYCTYCGQALDWSDVE